MEKLTKEYLNNHMNNIQSFDSFGRNLVQLIMESAIAKIGKEGANSDTVSVEMKFNVTSVHSYGCAMVRTYGPDGEPGCMIHVPGNIVYKPSAI